MTRHVFALALLALTGCGSQQEVEPKPIVPTTSKAIIPVEGPYTIISDRDEGRERRVVEVRLKQKVTPEALREIAMNVKSREEGQHEKTVIYYYLPVVFPELAGQPWATTHFKPALELKILGLSKQEEAEMQKIPLDHKGKRIGAWLPDDQYKTLDLIYDEDGVIKIAEIRSPTERSDSVMIELPSPIGRRFTKAKGSNVYYIDYAGNLRISNAEDKVFSAARPMK
jgi:hypothetical protein